MLRKEWLSTFFSQILRVLVAIRTLSGIGTALVSPNFLSVVTENTRPTGQKVWACVLHSWTLRNTRLPPDHLVRPVGVVPGKEYGIVSPATLVPRSFSELFSVLNVSTKGFA